MKKVIFTLLALSTFYVAAIAQADKDWKKATIDRPGDHIMVQLTSDHWLGAPDSISSHIGGLSRGLGISLLLDKPFKTDPHWSVAFGLGINGSNIFFNKMSVDLTAAGNVLPFRNLDSANHFKKYKLVTAYLELPVELRYMFSPQKENRSWKVALGLKVGTMINSHTKGKTLVNSAGNTINSYTEKINRGFFFNSTRFMATARVGRGHFSLVGNYSLSTLIKDGSGPEIRPIQIGLCISGL